MILKLLLVIAVIYGVWFFFIKKKPLHTKTKKGAENLSSDMVECAYCGVYSSLDDSILSNGKYYCSQECLESVK